MLCLRASILKYDNNSENIYFLNELYKICVLLVENGADALEKDRNNMLCYHSIEKEQMYKTPTDDAEQHIFSLQIKIKTYLEENIRERELLSKSFKRAQVCEDDDDESVDETEL